jgi:hypothetical protein
MGRLAHAHHHLVHHVDDHDHACVALVGDA